MPDNFGPTIIEVPTLRQVCLFLLNLVEKLTLENQTLREENQALRDEINHLKGEQGKPKMLSSQKPRDISSEKERHVPKTRPAKPRGHYQAVDRTEFLRWATL